MKLDEGKLAQAAAVTMGAWNIVCALVVIIAPNVAVRLFGMIAHLVNLERFVGGFTAVELLLGFIQVVVYSYLTVWVFARIYNQLLAKK